MVGKPFEVRLFGAPAMGWQGRPFTLARRQARALVYYLAHRLEPVSRDKLQFLFWPDKPQRKAKRNLTRLLSFVRGALPKSELLNSTTASIALDGRQVGSDATRFWRLIESKSVTHLAKATSLYRGPFLDGFDADGMSEYARWLEGQRRAFERRYLDTLARLTDNYQAAGHLERAIATSRAYLAVDELAENVHRQLIALHAASGDRAAAAQQFERCALVLERELGVSPLPETRAAYEAALEQRSTTKASPRHKPRWAVLPSLDLPLVGRHSELLALESAYMRLNQGGLILVYGESGTGKSRLLQAFAEGKTALVLSGQCHPTGRAVPYGPLVEIVRQALTHPQALATVSPFLLAEVGRLVPEVREVCPGLPAPIDTAPEQAQTRLFEALSRSLAAVTAGRTHLICLDDLHWADPATSGWLGSLPARRTDHRLCILATARTAEGQTLQPIQAAFERSGRFATLQLEGLSSAAIGDALEHLSLTWPSALQEELAQRLRQATGGNAFFVFETIRALLESKQRLAPVEPLPLAPTVEAAVGRRLSRLSQGALQILQTAAVLQPDLDPVLLRETAGRSDLELADALDELLARRLVRDGPSGLDFSHDLVRQVVYEKLTPWRRQLVHRRAAEALRARDKWPATVATHFDAVGLAFQAIDAYQAAADEAAAVYAHQEAVGYLERAITLQLESNGQDARRAELERLLGLNLCNHGRLDVARDVWRQALANWPKSDGVGQAELHWRIGRAYLAQLHYRRGAAELEEAIRALGPEPPPHKEAWWRLWLEIQLSFHYLHFCQNDPDKIRSTAKKIEPVTDWLDDPEIEWKYMRCRFLGEVLLSSAYRPTVADRKLLDRLTELATRIGDPATVATAYFDHAYSAFCRMESEESIGWLKKSLAIVRELGFRFEEANRLAFLSSAYRLVGDLEQTEAYAAKAVEAGRQVGSRHYESHGVANQAWLAYRRGQRQQALDRARQAQALIEGAGVPFGWLAHMVVLVVAQEQGELEEAVSAAQAMLTAPHQRVAEPLDAVLQEAVHKWANGERSGTADALLKVEEIARGLGYL